MDGFIVLKTSLENNPDVPVVILSASTQRGDMQRALAAGAKGFICKSSSPSVVINALRLVLAGGVYIPPEMVTVGNFTGTAGNTDSALENTGRKSIHLTPRQLEVLSFLTDGKGRSNKEIARKLGCSEATVKVHVTSILKSLGVVNRIQVKDAAEKLGLLTL
jgi:DNA-binding NarL/FixJ family response regulator